VKVGVLADDLTGAADAALAFERAGLRTEIARWGIKRPAGRPDVWVLDAASRSLAGAAARRRARAAAALLRRWKAAFIFKKIDSTLRGALGPEADGLLDAVGPQAGGLAFVPAFPALGRTTVGGLHFVRGVPLHRTDFGRDPRHPVSSSRVAEIVGKGRGRRGTLGLWIPDVPDEAALRRVARQALKNGARAAAGSAGFAAALAPLLKDGGKRSSARRPVFRRSARRSTVLVVSGSAHPLSQKQAALLAAERPGGVVLVAAPARRGTPGAVLRSVTGRALAAVRGWDRLRVAVTGGETAASLARAAGVGRWRVVEEVERGVPLLASVGDRRTSWWVMKPGGFGQEDLWTRAIKLLSRT
jgi:uncharacterized protein YgbK (DUF1537 family)